MKETDHAARVLTDHRASRTDRRAYVAASVSLVGLGTFVVGVLLLHLLKRDLDPAQHFISEYALGSFGWVQMIDFLAAGVGAIALALALTRVVNGPGRIAPILIASFGVCILLIAFIPTDGPGLSTTLGQAHGLIAISGFALLICGMFLIARKFRSDTAWNALRRPTIAWAGTALAALLLMPNVGTSLQGIGQRIFVVVIFSWMLAMAYHARNLARSAQPDGSKEEVS